MGIAENVRSMRKALRLSQSSLAKRSGVPQTTISAIELGNRMPTAETIILLSKGLGCTSDELLNDMIAEKKPAASNSDELKRRFLFFLTLFRKKNLPNFATTPPG